jgi:hypothetical protein
MNKSILLACFIFPERLDWFLSYLETKFNVTKDKVYCYSNLKDESKIILTFKLTLPEGKKIDLKNLFPNAVIIHKKGTAFYTINALNKLIESKIGDSIGNIDYKSYQIDWSEYQDKMILIDNKELIVLDLKRVF